MKKRQASVYEPIDKMVSAPWGFIKLVCIEHEGKKPEFEVIQTSNGPIYHCTGFNCGASFPAVVHERLLDNIVKMLNDKEPVIGYKWRKQVQRRVYSLVILSYTFEIGVTIGVKVLT